LHLTAVLSVLVLCIRYKMMFLHGLLFFWFPVVLVIVMYMPTCRFVLDVQSICIMAWWDRVVKLVLIFDRIYSCDVPSCIFSSSIGLIHVLLQ
jgi:hypothetical protein